MVAHACNLSYSRGRGNRSLPVCKFEASPGQGDAISKTKYRRKSWGVGQVVTHLPNRPWVQSPGKLIIFQDFFPPEVILMVQWNMEASFVLSSILLTSLLFDSENPGKQNVLFPLNTTPVDFFFPVGLKFELRVLYNHLNHVSSLFCFGYFGYGGCLLMYLPGLVSNYNFSDLSLPSSLVQMHV
jgi:hypothetical protein